MNLLNLQLKNINQISVNTVRNLVDNFIKYKTKAQYGDLKNHPTDCNCVDHLVKNHACQTIALKALVEKIKQEQNKKGAIPKRPNNTQSTTHKSVTNKISRDNVLQDRTHKIS